jgi:Tol biopolymer transport system component
MGSLVPGTRLGSYDILSALGAGGMGEVYRARDSKLGRDVALKILPESLSVDADRLARFRREAQLLASLNHTHISAIYGIEEAGGTLFLVLELVDGESLDKRIARGPVPIDDALGIATQIALALEAAHEKGIVHRDLKPANIALTASGNVKVLDFGLAKATEVTPVQSLDGGASPTFTSPAMITGAGAILGTATYMSPEQAKGREADKRSDVWAFGCVLYEMLTAKRPFAGEAITEVLASVIHTEPDWSALPPAVPGTIRRLLRRCLQKDPRKRLHDIADARLDLDEAAGGGAVTDAMPVAPAPPVKSSSRIAWSAAALMAVVAAWAIWTAMQAKPATPASPMRVMVNLPAVTTITLSRGSAVALSPDGRTLVYSATSAGRSQLYLRLLERPEATPIAGTDSASNPFFSPDGLWIGFFADGKLRKVSATGGTPVTVADAANPRGEAWGPDDTIYFTPRNNTGVWAVAASGGAPREVTKPAQGELSHRWPQILPGGKAVLYTSWNDTGFEGGIVSVQSLPAGEPRALVRGGGYARYVGPDAAGRSYLVYAQADGLLAAPFDLDTLSLTGPAVPVLDNVITNLSGGAHVAFSNSGTMAYLPGVLGELDRTLIWVDRKGEATPVANIRGMSLFYKLSPDGKRLVRHNVVGTDRDLWIEDLERGTSTRFTFGGAHFGGLWSPDGKWIAYSRGFPAMNLYRRRADGTGQEERLTTGGITQVTGSWTPDVGTLVFVENDPVSGSDIWTVAMDGDRTPRPFIKTPFLERAPVVSPDGKWLAYQSNESGRFEIYVVAFPQGDRKRQISTEGAFSPIWARNGRELFYQTGTALMATSVVTQPEFVSERPREVFKGRYEGTFDVSPDDQRFLLIKSLTQEASATQVNLGLNWFEELKRLLPASR